MHPQMWIPYSILNPGFVFGRVERTESDVLFFFFLGCQKKNSISSTDLQQSLQADMLISLVCVCVSDILLIVRLGKPIGKKIVKNNSTSD